MFVVKLKKKNWCVTKIKYKCISLSVHKEVRQFIPSPQSNFLEPQCSHQSYIISVSQAQAVSTIQDAHLTFIIGRKLNITGFVQVSSSHIFQTSQTKIGLHKIAPAFLCFGHSSETWPTKFICKLLSCIHQDI